MIRRNRPLRAFLRNPRGLGKTRQALQVLDQPVTSLAAGKVEPDRGLLEPLTQERENVERVEVRR